MNGEIVLCIIVLGLLFLIMRMIRKDMTLGKEKEKRHDER